MFLPAKSKLFVQKMAQDVAYYNLVFYFLVMNGNGVFILTTHRPRYVFPSKVVDSMHEYFPDNPEMTYNVVCQGTT